MDELEATADSVAEMERTLRGRNIVGEWLSAIRVNERAPVDRQRAPPRSPLGYFRQVFKDIYACQRALSHNRRYSSPQGRSSGAIKSMSCNVCCGALLVSGLHERG